MVADSLEADWNNKLRLLAESQEVCERQRAQDRKLIDEQQRAAILLASHGFSTALARSIDTRPGAEAYGGLLLEDVTLIREDRLTLHIRFNIRFKGGAHRTVQLQLPQRSWEQRQTRAEAVAAIDRLAGQSYLSGDRRYVE